VPANATQDASCDSLLLLLISCGPGAPPYPSIYLGGSLSPAGEKLLLSINVCSRSKIFCGSPRDRSTGQGHDSRDPFHPHTVAHARTRPAPSSHPARGQGQDRWMGLWPLARPGPPSSGAARRLPVLRCCTVPSPSSGAARAVSVCHAPAGSPAPNTRAARSERAREPSEASVPMHVSLAAGTVSAGRLCGPCGFWIFVATSSSNIRSRARPSLREDGVQ
jgi:hypothetical protein